MLFFLRSLASGIHRFYSGRFFVKHRLTCTISLIAIFFFVTSGFAQNPSTAAKTAPKIEVVPTTTSKTGKSPSAELIQKDLTEAFSVIEKNYGGTKKLDYNEVFKSSIEGMLHTLDPHSNYFDAKEFEQFKTDQRSQYFGIGATIGDLSDDKGTVIATYIKATFAGAPAHKAGLRYGDKIIDVNGTSMLGKPFGEVRTFLRGPQGTTAKITVEHLANGKRETVEIIRGAVPQPSIQEIYMLRPGVGYMAMRGGFNETTSKEFSDGLMSLKAQGATQLVIDLRDNGGGLVREAYRIASMLLSDGQIVFTQKARVRSAQVIEPYPAYSETQPDKTSPIVVLVNRGTASASEILSGALQDHDRALIVGENTFGKGLVQNPFQDIGYGSMLLLTIAKYETPSGRLIQRDYSNGELYNYYTDGGSLRNDGDDMVKPHGIVSKTDTGRAVYSGDGINPDVVIKPKTIPIERGRAQVKLINPIVGFAMELVAGRVSGFYAYKIDKPITFKHDLTPSDFPVDERLIQALKTYSSDKYHVTAAQIDGEKDFVTRTLRSELITAAYGSETTLQVFSSYDDQLLRAIDQLPQAKQLAVQSEKLRTAASNQKSPINR